MQAQTLYKPCIYRIFAAFQILKTLHIRKSARFVDYPKMASTRLPKPHTTQSQTIRLLRVITSLQNDLYADFPGCFSFWANQGAGVHQVTAWERLFAGIISATVVHLWRAGYGGHGVRHSELSKCYLSPYIMCQSVTFSPFCSLA